MNQTTLQKYVLASAFGGCAAAFGLPWDTLGFWVLLILFALYGIVLHAEGFEDGLMGLNTELKRLGKVISDLEERVAKEGVTRDEQPN